MTQLTLYSIHDIALRCGVDTTFVQELVTLGVIHVHPTHPTHFECEVTLRVSKLYRLQRDLGINLEGAALIVELLDRIEVLEERLAQVERR